jgi:type IV fimbrial biogenesis protein FimT
MVRHPVRSQLVRGQLGFTLTEALITLAVLGVIAALAVPSLNSFVVNSRVKQAATDMFMTVAYARNEAINRNTQVSVNAVGAWGTGWQVVTAGGNVLKQTTLTAGVTITGPAGNSLTYNPNGRLTTAGAVNFTFTVPGNPQITMRCVTSTLIGQPVLQADLNRDGNCANG